jgi:PadR family transcriptional regulator, regulatory protein AphA
MLPLNNSSLYAVLGMLSLRPMSGYDIKKTIEGSVSNFWNESFGQIYPMLTKLLAAGFVEETGDRESRKREFKITKRGRAALGEWLERPARFQPSRNETLLKVFLAAELPPSTIAEHLRRFRRHHADALERYAAIERRLTEQHANHAGLPYWLLTLRYGQRESEAMLAWCDEAERDLKKLEKRKKKTNA